MYNNVRVKVEYPAPFNTKKGIDIVVVMDNEYYPIELKYKRKSFKGIVDNIEYDLPRFIFKSLLSFYNYNLKNR